MKEKIKSEFKLALKSLSLLAEEIPIIIEVPQNEKFGDYSTNFAFLYAKQQRTNPFQVANRIVEELQKRKSNLFEKIEVAKPAFINFTLSRTALLAELRSVVMEKDKYGQGKELSKKKILLEFVSANPTGPLHIGHGRWAVLGDALARLLSSQGAKVDREFYINNVGKQIKMLLASVRAALEGKDAPEGGYQGRYIKDLAEEVKLKRISDKALEDFVLKTMLAAQKKTLSDLGVEFKAWFSEKDLHRKGKVVAAADKLKKTGKTFFQDGALWFKSQDYGDDKNRVLLRENGDPTYFTADIAYHINKFERKYDQLINIWGTDHHGYVVRLCAALKALGLHEDKLKIIIGQLVSLYRGKEPVRMSKRTGEMVTLEEVVEEIGSDATRFFLSMTSEHTHVDFDLELAQKRSDENPVFYVQYAHARICSIFRQEDTRRPKKLDFHKVDLGLLTHEAEIKLIKKLVSLPDLLLESALAYEPHRLATFARDTAALFHNFYHNCRVISADIKQTEARFTLIAATRVVIANVLKLLNISAPERM